MLWPGPPPWHEAQYVCRMASDWALTETHGSLVAFTAPSLETMSMAGVVKLSGRQKLPPPEAYCRKH
jgi:hypothetical protein